MRVVAAVGLVGALVLGAANVAVARVADRVTALSADASSDAPSAPVMSARRTPNTLSDTTRIGGLERALATFASRVPDNGCLVVEWAGRTVASVRPDLGLVPASAAKVITASAALDVLGADHTFETSVSAMGGVQNGTVGDLYLIGGGDPVLVSAPYVATEKYGTISGTPLEKFVDSIVAAGVRQVTGSIVAVDARYDQVRFVDAWPSDFHVVEAGPLGALVFNDGAVTGMAQKPDDPAIAAAMELRLMLATRGIVVAGEPRHEGAAPESAVRIATVTSAPLTSIVREMLVNSDNNTAELLVKEIGFEASKSGSTSAGLTAIQKAAQRWRTTSPVLVDGSGLASGNRASCSAFRSILSSRADVFVGSMSVAGSIGTLRGAFTDSPMDGRLVGKTGTLNGVKSLVGYLPLEGSQPVVFALLMNRPGIDNQGEYRPVWNAFGEALNRAKARPTSDELAP